MHCKKILLYQKEKTTDKRTQHTRSDKNNHSFLTERGRMIMKKLLKEIEEMLEAYYKTFA